MTTNKKDPVLVVLQLSGGNDYFNTVIPHTDPLYRDNRPAVGRIGVVGDTSRPGIQRIIQRLQAMGELAPEAFVDNCLDLLGILEVEEENRRQLVEHAKEGGPLSWSTREEEAASAERVGEMLQLAVSLREYLYA